MLVNKVMVVLFLFFGFLFLARLVGKEFVLSGDGYDERQKIYRDRGYKWGFYAILLLLFISMFASEELRPYLTIETLSLLILSAGVFTTMAYWIWTDAYFKPKHKGILSGAFFFLIQAGLQVNWILSDYRYWQALGETETIWEFSDSLPFYLLAATCFLFLGVSLLVKYALEKWGTKE